MDGGFLSNLISGITRPFRGTADLVTTALGSAILPYNQELGANITTLLDQTPIGLSQQEQDAIYKGSAVNLFKPAAGVSSYAIPGAGAGGSVSRAAGLGALSGGLGGFSAARRGSELKDIASGAAIGGVLGGTLQAGSNFLKQQQANRAALMEGGEQAGALSTQGRVSEAKGTGFWEKGAPTQQNLDALNRGQEAIETAGGKLRATPQGNLDEAFKARDFHRAAKADILTELGEIPGSSYTQIEDDLLETLSDPNTIGIKAAYGESKAVNDAKNTVIDAFANTAQNPTAQNLDDLAAQLYEEGVNFGRKNFTSSERVYKAAAKTIRDDLADLASVVGGDVTLSDANRHISSLMDILGGKSPLGKAAKEVQRDLSLGAVVGGVSAPLQPKVLTNVARTYGGRALQSIGGATTNLPGTLGTLTQAGASTLPKVVPQIVQDIDNGKVTVGPEKGQISEETMLLAMGGQQQQQGQGMDIVSALALAQQLQPYGSESELLSLAKAIQADSSPSSTKLTESDKAYAQAREGFVDALAFLEQNGGSGKINTFTGNIKAFFGKTSANSQFQAKISNSTAALRKALIGTGQSEVELKNLNLPKATDEPAVARQKLIEAIKYIDQRPMGGNIGVDALSGILGY